MNLFHFKGTKNLLLSALFILAGCAFLTSCDDKVPVPLIDPTEMPIASFTADVSYVTEKGDQYAVITCKNYSYNTNRYEWNFPNRGTRKTESMDPVTEKYSAAIYQELLITLTAYCDIKTEDIDTVIVKKTGRTVIINPQK